MKNVIRIIWLGFILFLVTNSVSGSVSELTIFPDNPVAGEKIILKGVASSDEVLKSSIAFEQTVNVAKGNNKFSYEINGIEIPSGKNQFTVTAENVENLNVGVKLLIWWKKSKDSVNGLATISQANVPGGPYHIKIYGTALEGATSVLLKITATSQIDADNKGNFEYDYSTFKLPTGTYTVSIGGETRTIELLAKSDKPHKDDKTDPANPVNAVTPGEKHAVTPEKTPDTTTIPAKPEKTPGVHPTVVPTVTEKTPDPTTTPATPEKKEESLFRRLIKMIRIWD